MPTRGGSGRQPERSLGRAVRWPAMATGLTLAMVLAGFILDTSPGRGRDLALLVGGPALTVLLPLSVIWLVAAIVLYRRQGRPR